MSADPDLVAPDYRIILKDRRQIFVEVKTLTRMTWLTIIA